MLHEGIEFIDNYDHVVDIINKDGAFEPGTTKLWKELVQGALTIFDIGAYNGYYALIAAKNCLKDARIYAFEPMPDNYERMVKNIHLNNFYEKITSSLCAVSNNGYAKTLHRFSGGKYLTSGGSLDKNWMPKPANETWKVPCIQLSKHFKTIDLIKIDVEGHEPEILEDIKDIANHIIIEVVREYDLARLNRLSKDFDIYLIEETSGLLLSRKEITVDKQSRNWLLKR